VPDIPFVFPKFYIVIIAKELKVEIGELKIIVSMPENEPIALNLPAPPRQIISQDLQLAVGISPLKINKEGKVKIEAFQGGDIKPFISHHVSINKEK